MEVYVVFDDALLRVQVAYMHGADTGSSFTVGVVHETPPAPACLAITKGNRTSNWHKLLCAREGPVARPLHYSDRGSAVEGLVHGNA